MSVRLVRSIKGDKSVETRVKSKSIKNDQNVDIEALIDNEEIIYNSKTNSKNSTTKKSNPTKFMYPKEFEHAVEKTLHILDLIITPSVKAKTYMKSFSTSFKKEWYEYFKDILETDERQNLLEAITHVSAGLGDNNLENFELIGDKLGDFVFLQYLENRYQRKMSEDEGTIIINRYMSNSGPFFSQYNLAIELEIDDMLIYNPEELHPESRSYKEAIGDMVESLSGFLFRLLKYKYDENISKVDKYVTCTDIENFYKKIYADVDFMAVETENKTQLKELLTDRLRIPYRIVSKWEDDAWVSKIVLSSNGFTFNIIGADADKATSQFLVSENVLNYLKKHPEIDKYIEERHRIDEEIKLARQNLVNSIKTYNENTNNKIIKTLILLPNQSTNTNVFKITLEFDNGQTLTARNLKGRELIVYQELNKAVNSRITRK